MGRVLGSKPFAVQCSGLHRIVALPLTAGRSKIPCADHSNRCQPLIIDHLRDSSFDEPALQPRTIDLQTIPSSYANFPSHYQVRPQTRIWLEVPYVPHQSPQTFVPLDRGYSSRQTLEAALSPLSVPIFDF